MTVPRYRHYYRTVDVDISRAPLISDNIIIITSRGIGIYSLLQLDPWYRAHGTNMGYSSFSSISILFVNYVYLLVLLLYK